MAREIIIYAANGVEAIRERPLAGQQNLVDRLVCERGLVRTRVAIADVDDPALAGAERETDARTHELVVVHIILERSFRSETSAQLDGRARDQVRMLRLARLLARRDRDALALK